MQEEHNWSIKAETPEISSHAVAEIEAMLNPIKEIDEDIINEN